MTEHDWQTSTDPVAMLDYLQDKASNRKLRLFVCACCRQVRDRLPDERSRCAVEVAERYADGLATADELEAVNTAALAAQGAAVEGAAWAAVWWAIRPAVWYAAWSIVRQHCPSDVTKTKTAILRTLFGNPFDRVAIDPYCRTSDVLAIAQRIYDDRDWDAMPMLADALEGAGCEDAEILEHLRGRERCGPCEVEHSGQRMQVSWAFIQLNKDWGFPEKPKSKPAYLPQCKRCHGSGWRLPRQPPVRCRGDWVLDLVLNKE